MNENYRHPAMPENAEEGIIKGIYKLQSVKPKSGKSQLRVRLLGGGTILREVIAAANMLAEEYDIASDIYSVTSFNELARDGLATERWNMLHPQETPRVSFISQVLGDDDAPVISSTDYMKTYSDQVREYVQATFVALGTDGFGRSDTREKLREFFEVDRRYVTVAALHALAMDGKVERTVVANAIQQYAIDPDKPDPTTV